MLQYMRAIEQACKADTNFSFQLLAVGVNAIQWRVFCRASVPSAAGSEGGSLWERRGGSAAGEGWPPPGDDGQRVFCGASARPDVLATRSCADSAIHFFARGLKRARERGGQALPTARGLPRAHRRPTSWPCTFKFTARFRRNPPSSPTRSPTARPGG